LSLDLLTLRFVNEKRGLKVLLALALKKVGHFYPIQGSKRGAKYEQGLKTTSFNATWPQIKFRVKDQS